MENDKCPVQFKYKCEGTIYQKVGIVGSIDNLKNWNIDNPVFLSYNIKEKLFISSQIELPKNKLIEYKYVFHHKDEKIWEYLPGYKNRQLEIKENKPLIILDTERNPNSIKEIVSKKDSPPKIGNSNLKKPSTRKKSNQSEEAKKEKKETNTRKIKKLKKRKQRKKVKKI